MILNGKAFTDFGDQCKYDYNEFLKLDEPIQYALIIEWFDSVNFYVEVIRNEGYFEYFVHEEWDYGFETRQEATKQAIIKANDIYNTL